MINQVKPYIICAAIFVDDGQIHPHQPKNILTGLVVCGRRHHNCFTTLALTNVEYKRNNTIQGFLTSHDRFVDRKEGAEIAFEAGQIKEETNILMSEDIY